MNHNTDHLTAVEKGSVLHGIQAGAHLIVYVRQFIRAGFNDSPAVIYAAEVSRPRLTDRPQTAHR